MAGLVTDIKSIFTLLHNNQYCSTGGGENNSFSTTGSHKTGSGSSIRQTENIVNKDRLAARVIINGDLKCKPVDNFRNNSTDSSNTKTTLTPSRFIKRGDSILPKIIPQMTTGSLNKTIFTVADEFGQRSNRRSSNVESSSRFNGMQHVKDGDGECTDSLRRPSCDSTLAIVTNLVSQVAKTFPENHSVGELSSNRSGEMFNQRVVISGNVSAVGKPNYSLGYSSTLLPQDGVPALADTTPPRHYERSSQGKGEQKLCLRLNNDTSIEKQLEAEPQVTWPVSTNRGDACIDAQRRYRYMNESWSNVLSTDL